MQTALTKIFPTHIGSIISAVLEQSGVADELVRTFIKKHPRKTDILNRAFSILFPPEALRDKDPALYRHHVEELLNRAMSGESMHHATKAEILSAISQTSLRTPIQQDYAALMERLFADIFGNTPDGAPFSQESWEGATDEILNALRKQLANHERRV